MECIDNTKTLKEEIKKLKYMIEHSSSKSLKNYYTSILLNLSDLLYELTDEIEEIKISKKNYNFMIKYNCNLDKEVRDQVNNKTYMEMVNTLTQNSTEIIAPIEHSYYFDSNISLNEAKILIKDFICKYDISLYQLVEKVLSDDHLFLIKEKLRNGNGYSIYNAHSSSSYIVLYTDNYDKKLNIENLICLMHELGHVIHFHTTINNARPKNYNRIIMDNFIEVPSSNLETLFIKYLINNKVQQNGVRMVLNNNLKMLKGYLSYLQINNLIIDLIPNDIEVDFDYIKNLLLSKGINKDDSFINTCFNRLFFNYEYSYGGLLSYYYLDLYEKDPEKTKKNMNDFSKCIGVMDDMYMLTHFGIILDKFIECDYLKKVVEENQKQLELIKR